MRQLRFAVTLAAIGSFAGFGCDGDEREMDSGVGSDSGTTLMDSGPGTDSGTGDEDGGGTGTDSGMMMGECGPSLPGDCDITQDIALAGGGSGTPACGAGMACLPGAEGEGGQLQLQCFMAGTGMDGDACDPMMSGQCAEGYGCSQFEEVCRRWCCSTGDCEIGQNCTRFTNVNVGICESPCSILEQTGCDAGQACYHAGDGVGACRAEGTAEVGDACGGDTGVSCVGGLGCFGDPDTGEFFCRAWCDPDAPDCETGTTCARFAESGGSEPVPGIGFCNPDGG